MTFTASLDDYMPPTASHGPLTEADALCLGRWTVPVSNSEKLAAGLALGPEVSATTAYRLLDALGYRLPADNFYELDAADLHSRVLLAQAVPPLSDNGVGVVVIGSIVDAVAVGAFHHIYQNLATLCEYAMLWDVPVILA